MLHDCTVTRIFLVIIMVKNLKIEIKSLRMPLKSQKCKWEKSNVKMPKKISMDYETQNFEAAS
jgi:hypothetical protein